MPTMSSFKLPTNATDRLALRGTLSSRLAVSLCRVTGPQPFATHICDDRGAYNGRYFETLEDARADFEAREI